MSRILSDVFKGLAVVTILILAPFWLLGRLVRAINDRSVASPYYAERLITEIGYFVLGGFAWTVAWASILYRLGWL